MEQIQYIPIDCVETHPQVRRAFDAESIEGLAASIRNVGLQQPCRVRRVNNKFVIIHGERRLRAAKIAGLVEIPVIIEEKELSEGEILQRQLIENCQRENLQPIERASAIARMMKVTGWKISEAAAKLGMSNASASRLLALLNLPESIQQQVAVGVIPASAGYELSRIDDPSKQNELANELAQGRLTRDALSGSIKSRTRKGVSDTAPSTGRATAKLGGGRAVTVVGQSLSLEGFIEILEELLAKARKVRTQGVELDTFVKMLKDQAQAG